MTSEVLQPEGRNMLSRSSAVEGTPLTALHASHHARIFKRTNDIGSSCATEDIGSSVSNFQPPAAEAISYARKHKAIYIVSHMVFRRCIS